MRRLIIPIFTCTVCSVEPVTVHVKKERDMGKDRAIFAMAIGAFVAAASLAVALLDYVTGGFLLFPARHYWVGIALMGIGVLYFLVGMASFFRFKAKPKAY